MAKKEIGFIEEVFGRKLLYLNKEVEAYKKSKREVGEFWNYVL